MAQALPQIWEREMWTDVYFPHWVSLSLRDNRQDSRVVNAVAFVTNPGSEQFADLSQTEMAGYIAEAKGDRGTCFDYLSNTVTSLRELSIREPELERLLEASRPSSRL